MPRQRPDQILAISDHRRGWPLDQHGRVVVLGIGPAADMPLLAGHGLRPYVIAQSMLVEQPDRIAIDRRDHIVELISTAGAKAIRVALRAVYRQLADLMIDDRPGNLIPAQAIVVADPAGIAIEPGIA